MPFNAQVYFLLHDEPMMHSNAAAKNNTALLNFMLLMLSRFNYLSPASYLQSKKEANIYAQIP